MQAYQRIKETEGNFSEWISNLVIAYDNGELANIAMIDALRRRIRSITNELQLLYNNNGVVRREMTKNCYPILEGICLGDDL